MSTGGCYFLMLFFRLLPETRLFGFKALLLRLIGVKVGCNVRICSSVRITGGGRLEIGDDTWIGNEVMIACTSGVRIGRCVDIGPRAYIGTGTHQLDASGNHSAGQGISLDVVVGDGVWIGAAAMVLPGVNVGRKAVLAAGAVAVKSVPEGKVVGGVPARVIRDL